MRRKAIPQNVVTQVMSSAQAAFDASSERLEDYLERHLGGDGGLLPKGKQWAGTLLFLTLLPGRQKDLFRSVFCLKSGVLISFETCLPLAVTSVELYRGYEKTWPW